MLIMDRNVLDKISERLLCIDDKSINYYKNNTLIFIEYVNGQIRQRDDCALLTGSNPFELVEMNHKNHATFMYNVFLTKDAQNLHDTYVWAYGTYYSKGFVFRYFYLELTAWREAFESSDRETLAPIIELYDYLISLHDYFVKYATSTKEEVPKNLDEELYNDFLKALLKPDVNVAIEISNAFIKTDDDIKSFWEHIILPALYSVGNKWAIAEISVGEEHTATSICQRVMSEHYSKIIKHIEKKTRVLVTTSPNELHEVGARMLADILELNGYDVRFLSSHSTLGEKLEMIYTEDIELIAISTTVVSNISKTKEIVDEIREKFKDKTPKIVVGGQAFTKNTNANEIIKADYCLTTAHQLLKILKEAE